VQDVFRCQVDDMGGYFAPFSMQSSLHVRIYQQRTGKFLNKSDFQRPEACILIASAPSKVQSFPFDCSPQSLALFSLFCILTSSFF
jgi:hypothetical protein